jgi:hypothetical protein
MATVLREDPVLVEMIAGEEGVVRTGDAAETVVPAVPSVTTETVVAMARGTAAESSLVIPCKTS